MKKEKSLDKTLSLSTFISGTGDHLTFFSIVLITQELFNNVALSAYNIAIASIAVALGSISVPYVIKKLKPRNVLLVSELASFALLIGLIYFYKNNLITHPAHLYLIIFCKYFLNVYFGIAKEGMSNSANTQNQQTSSIKKLLTGMFGSQIIGPVLAFFVISKFGVVTALTIDALSFILSCGVIWTKLKNTRIQKSLFRYPKTLWKFTNFRKLTFIRYFLVFFPIAVYNITVFDLFKTHLGSSVLKVAWSNSALGFGAAVAVIFLKIKDSEYIIGDKKIAASGLAIIGLGSILLATSNTLTTALIVSIFSGFGLGLYTIGSGAIRRKVVGKKFYVNFISIERFVGQISNFSICTLTVFLLSNNYITYTHGFIFSGIGFFLIAIYHLSYLDSPLEIAISNKELQ